MAKPSVHVGFPSAVFRKDDPIVSAPHQSKDLHGPATNRSHRKQENEIALPSANRSGREKNCLRRAIHSFHQVLLLLTFDTNFSFEEYFHTLLAKGFSLVQFFQVADTIFRDSPHTSIDLLAR